LLHAFLEDHSPALAEIILGGLLAGLSVEVAISLYLSHVEIAI
jgi:hypothetical protein